MEILRVGNVSKVYGSRKNRNKYEALKNISFHVREGEFNGVMGASGSGKTTLLNLLGSLDRPSSGQIIINGSDIAKLKKNELANHLIKNIGFIFQDYNLLETMTLKENIILPLALMGMQADKMEERLAPLASDLGIEEILYKYSYEVSGGEQQRAAACRALITQPKIILADEPTGNLDSTSSNELLELLTFINKQYSTTIVMVTHDIYAASYCRKIIFIKDGEIYNELYSGESKQEFHNSIIHVMSALGGRSS